jgi:hypothetical protein
VDATDVDPVPADVTWPTVMTSTASVLGDGTHGSAAPQDVTVDGSAALEGQVRDLVV